MTPRSPYSRSGLDRERRSAFWRGVCGLAIAATLLTGSAAEAARQGPSSEKPVSIHVEIGDSAGSHSGTAAEKGSRQDASQVVAWLIPRDAPLPPLKPRTQPPLPQMVQRNKSFQPHLLVVPVGSLVAFPNRDPFFHNVFSLYNGKRFDLGLYESGSSRAVRFDRPGISYLFCNIHSDMSAVVVALETPYFGISNRAGRISIAGIPDGRYDLHFWYERGIAADLEKLTQIVSVSDESRAFGPVVVPTNPHFTLTHTNKYGQPYVPPPAEGYPHP